MCNKSGYRQKIILCIIYMENPIKGAYVHGGEGGHGYVSPYVWDPICIRVTYFKILEIDCKIQ